MSVPNAVRNDDSVQPDIAKMVRSLCYGYTNNVAVKAEVSTAEYTFYRWRDDLHVRQNPTDPAYATVSQGGDGLRGESSQLPISHLP